MRTADQVSGGVLEIKTLAHGAQCIGRAGIGGLAAASVLARDRNTVTVLEQAPEFDEIGAGIQPGPNIFKMYDDQGITEMVNQVASFKQDNDGVVVTLEGGETRRVLH